MVVYLNTYDTYTYDVLIRTSYYIHQHDLGWSLFMNMNSKKSFSYKGFKLFFSVCCFCQLRLDWPSVDCCCLLPYLAGSRNFSCTFICVDVYMDSNSMLFWTLVWCNAVSIIYHVFIIISFFNHQSQIVLKIMGINE